MAKSTKKEQPRVVKPITDFFQRIPSSSQASGVSDSASSQPRPKGEAASKHSTQSALLSKHSASHPLKQSTANNSRVESSPHRPTTISPRKPMESLRLKAPLFRTASLKRPRSPEGPKASPTTKLTDKNAAQASQPNKSSPRKKARLSASPTSSLVPSSQSDEEELPTPRTNSPSKSAAKEGVKQWRKKTRPPTPDPVTSSASSSALSVEMDVDGPSYSSGAVTPATSEQEISAQLNESPRTSTSGPTQILTPPYTVNGSSDDLPAPAPTPIALTAEEKSARRIQEIKARAFARAAEESSPELKAMEMELNDSDDDDDVDPLNLGILGPNPAPSASTGPSLRRSSRQRASLSATSDGSPVSRPRRYSPNDVSSSEDEAPRARPTPKTRHNPIEALLKEKEKAEKGGKGSGAFLTAESSLIGKNLMLEEMSLEDYEEEDDDVDYDNLKNTDYLPASALSSLQHSEDLALKEEDRKDLFEEEEGAAINEILRSEARARKAEAEEAKKRKEGVPLWATGGDEDTMMVDEQQLFIPAFAPGTHSATLRRIDQALQQRDFDQAAFLLKSGTLSRLAAADNSDVLNALCALATSAKLFELPISVIAFRVAIDLLENTSGGKALVSSSFVIRAMLELGAPAERLESVQVKYDHTPRFPVDMAKRAEVLYRVIALISQTAIARRIASQEIPDLVMSLVLMAMDTSNPVQLQQELYSAINNVFEFLASTVAGSNRDLESTLASRLVGLAEGLQPANKAFLASIFASGSGATLRIARFIAYCMVTGTTSQSITSKTYCNPPPLSRLLSLLIEPADSKDVMEHSQASPFIINEGTDYTIMKFYVYIFGIALGDIRSYVWDERNKDRDANKASGPRPSWSSKEKKPETDLQLLHDLMEEFHANINDLRAAHLDRSRVKAAVKQLQMRIYYQRLAFDRAWKDQNLPKASLTHWIKKPLKAGP